MKKIFYRIIFLSILLAGGFLYLGIQYPICYVDTIVDNSIRYGTDPYLIASIINVESRYDEKATSKKEAKGLMQITETTGKWGSEETGIVEYSDERLYEPEVNIRIGTWYISRLFKEFNGDGNLVLAAYNAGSGNVRKWLKDSNYSEDGKTLKKIPFKETEDYLARVEKNYKVYRGLYRNKFKDDELKDSDYISYLHGIKRVFKINKY